MKDVIKMIKKKGYTIVELMIVIAIIGLIFSVAPVILKDYIENEQLEKALTKIKYDIRYIQNLRLDKTENYTIAFRRSLTQGVSVVGITDTQFDYVCYNDLNNNGLIEYDEVIEDPFSKKKMMYSFSNDSKYNEKVYRNIKFNSIIFHYSGGSNNKIRFNQIGGIQV